MSRASSLPLLLVSSLAACGGSSSLGETTTVSGTFASWNNVSGVTINALISNQVIASTTVDAGGKFSLTLPSGDAIASKLTAFNAAVTAQGCSGALNISPGESKIGLVTFSLSGALTSSAGYGKVVTSNGTIDIVAGTYVYSDRDLSVSGQQTCANNTTVQANISAGKGWNTVLLHTITNTVAKSTTLEIDTAALGGDLQWVKS